MDSKNLRNLYEAYTEIYEETVDDVSYEYDIFETISYALISSGLTANDVIDYFTNTNEDTIVEDYIELVEGTLIIENIVEDEYIEEQFQQLDEAVGAALRLGHAAVQAAKYAPKGQKALSALGGAGKAATRISQQGAKASSVVRPGLARAGQAIRGAASNVKSGLGSAASRLRGGAQGASGGTSGGQGRAGKALSTAGKWALGGAGFEAGAAGVRALTGGKGSAKEDSDKSKSTQPPAPRPAASGGGGAPRPAASGGGAPRPAAAPSAKPAAPTRASSPADASTADKIKGGTSVYDAQRKAGDFKAASETGSKTWAKSNPSLANKPKTPNPLLAGGDIRRMQQASQMRQKGIDITSNQIKAAERAKPTTKESLDWGSTSKVAEAMASAYINVYEAKKKDQDEDGDNDFADVRIARMVAAGIPKEEAIRRVKDKSYNEETELDEAAKRTPKKVRGAKDEKSYMAGRSDAGKRISGDEKTGPRHYTLGSARGAKLDSTTSPGAKPINTPKVSKSELNYARTRHKDVSGKDWKKVGGPKGLPEDFEFWINELLDEGYDLSEYTWDEMYEIYEETAKEKEERVNNRRARIAELQVSGRVMNSSKRASARAKERREEKKVEELEKLANAAIEATRGATRRSSKPMGTTAPEKPAAAPSANRRLSASTTKDTLASKADKILRSLQNEDFQLWVQELLDEGYDLDNWTDIELVSLYEDIINKVYED